MGSGRIVDLQLASPIIQTINLNMRFSFLTFLLAASTAVVSAYDFDSRVVSSRDVSDSSSSLRLSRRAHEIQDLIAARDLIDSILEERSIFSKKKKAPSTTGPEQKAASAELQKWSMAAVNAKKALERLQKNKAGSMSGKKKEEMDIRKCLGFNEEGAAHFRAIAMGSRDPARQRKPATAPCVYKGNGSFTNLPA